MINHVFTVPVLHAPLPSLGERGTRTWGTGRMRMPPWTTMTSRFPVVYLQRTAVVRKRNVLDLLHVTDMYIHFTHHACRLTHCQAFPYCVSSCQSVILLQFYNFLKRILYYYSNYWLHKKVQVELSTLKSLPITCICWLMWSFISHDAKCLNFSVTYIKEVFKSFSRCFVVGITFFPKNRALQVRDFINSQ